MRCPLYSHGKITARSAAADAARSAEAAAQAAQAAAEAAEQSALRDLEARLASGEISEAEFNALIQDVPPGAE
ncbi:SHOCT domain-containing protein [Alphaproteobacteria bacterium]|nr:SHOCT domain-containing protein [Alphaproteobacteria bacterium]